MCNMVTKIIKKKVEAKRRPLRTERLGERTPVRLGERTPVRLGERTPVRFSAYTLHTKHIFNHAYR
jgi:hypothetical protein